VTGELAARARICSLMGLSPSTDTLRGILRINPGYLNISGYTAVPRTQIAACYLLI